MLGGMNVELHVAFAAVILTKGRSERRGRAKNKGALLHGRLAGLTLLVWEVCAAQGHAMDTVMATMCVCAWRDENKQKI